MNKEISGVLENLYQKIKEVAERFPLTCFFAVTGTVSALWLTRQIGSVVPTNLVLISVLGFFWSVAAYLATEERWRSVRNHLLVALIVLLGVYYLILPVRLEDFRYTDQVRFLVLFFSAVPAIMAAPFLKGEAVNAFWHFNRKLCTRLFFTFIYTGALFLGLVLCLLSVNYLFELNIREEWFPRIWILVAGLISTSVFLSGVPHKPSTLERETEYPKFIQAFARYILLPLLSLYALILYAYGAKILATRAWPEGSVASFILVFYTVAILALVLLYAEWRKGGAAGSLVSHSLFGLLPLLGLFWGAVWVRVSEYGLTESRVGIILAGAWFLGIAVYFILANRKDIRIIPISIAILALLAVLAPVNIFSVSLESQLNRLEGLLIENRILVRDRIQTVDPALISPSDTENMFSILEYLDQADGLDRLNQWFGSDLTKLPEGSRLRASKILGLMGLSFPGTGVRK